MQQALSQFNKETSNLPIPNGLDALKKNNVCSTLSTNGDVKMMCVFTLGRMRGQIRFRQQESFHQQDSNRLQPPEKSGGNGTRVPHNPCMEHLMVLRCFKSPRRSVFHLVCKKSVPTAPKKRANCATHPRTRCVAQMTGDPMRPT